MSMSCTRKEVYSVYVKNCTSCAGLCCVALTYIKISYKRNDVSVLECKIQHMATRMKLGLTFVPV